MKYLLFLMTLIGLNIFAQGPIDGFYKGQGNATAVLGFGLEDFYEYLGGKNKTGLNREGQYANLFASYGITNNLDVQASLPYLEVAENKSFQDLSVYSKYRFYKNENSKLELSFGGGFSTPISNYNIGGLNDIGQQATVIDFRFMGHYKLKKGWFATLQSGYSLKSDITPNSYPLAIKIGKSSKSWYYDVFYDFQYAMGGRDYRGTPAPRSFKELGVSYNKIGGTLYKSITKAFGLYISVSHIVSGRNTFLGTTYASGLVYSYRKNKA